MNFYLLDAAAGGLILGFLIVFMLLAVLLEGLTMLLLKYNRAGKSFLDALVVNIPSLLAGLLIATFADNGIDLTDNEFLNIFLLFLITVIIEFPFLYLLNRKKPIAKTIVAAIMINVVSYLLFIGVTFFFANAW